MVRLRKIEIIAALVLALFGGNAAAPAQDPAPEAKEHEAGQNAGLAVLMNGDTLRVQVSEATDLEVPLSGKRADGSAAQGTVRISREQWTKLESGEYALDRDAATELGLASGSLAYDRSAFDRVPSWLSLIRASLDIQKVAKFSGNLSGETLVEKAASGRYPLTFEVRLKGPGVEYNSNRQPLAEGKMRVSVPFTVAAAGTVDGTLEIHGPAEADRPKSDPRGRSSLKDRPVSGRLRVNDPLDQKPTKNARGKIGPTGDDRGHAHGDDRPDEEPHHKCRITLVDCPLRSPLAGFSGEEDGGAPEIPGDLTVRPLWADAVGAPIDLSGAGGPSTSGGPQGSGAPTDTNASAGGGKTTRTVSTSHPDRSTVTTRPGNPDPWHPDAERAHDHKSDEGGKFFHIHVDCPPLAPADAAGDEAAGDSPAGGGEVEEDPRSKEPIREWTASANYGGGLHAPGAPSSRATTTPRMSGPPRRLTLTGGRGTVLWTLANGFSPGFPRIPTSDSHRHTIYVPGYHPCEEAP